MAGKCRLFNELDGSERRFLTKSGFSVLYPVASRDHIGSLHSLFPSTVYVYPFAFQMSISQHALVINWGYERQEKDKKMVICYLHGSNESNVTLFFHTGRFENSLIRDKQMGLVYWALSLKAIYQSGGGGVICWWRPWPSGRIFCWHIIKKEANT